jgi:predicted nucleic acid-binding protein
VIVVDSSSWLEFLADGPNAAAFAPAFKDLSLVIVPTISLFEVAKCVSRQKGSADALRAVAPMQQAVVVDLTSPIALMAARLGREHRSPLADSVMLATARSHGATLWRQDAAFDGLPGVRYFKAKASGR